MYNEAEKQNKLTKSK